VTGAGVTEVYSSPNLATFWLVKTHLDSLGISCEVTNDILYAVAGEVPMDQCWPRLHVLDDADADVARERIKEFLAASEGQSLPSFCPKCDSAEVELAGKSGGVLFPKFRCRQCGHTWRYPGR
jgi:hypothetical protein